VNRASRDGGGTKWSTRSWRRAELEDVGQPQRHEVDAAARRLTSSTTSLGRC
jgi:hypothetical protein